MRTFDLCIITCLFQHTLNPSRIKDIVMFIRINKQRISKYKDKKFERMTSTKKLWNHSRKNSNQIQFRS
jgi:hypothetical protein